LMLFIWAFFPDTYFSMLDLGSFCVKSKRTISWSLFPNNSSVSQRK
jgi:hypothetical protein